MSHANASLPRHRLSIAFLVTEDGWPISKVAALLNRLSHGDRKTGEPVRRYEHDYSGAMLHVDLKKLGDIPDRSGAMSAANKARRTAPTPPTSPATNTTIR